MKEKNHIGTLLGAFVILLMLMTGCAKDELIPPAGEQDSFMKSSELLDADKPRIDNATKGNDDADTDGITDDEDDEDDEDREENR